MIDLLEDGVRSLQVNEPVTETLPEQCGKNPYHVRIK